MFVGTSIPCSHMDFAHSSLILREILSLRRELIVPYFFNQLFVIPG